MDQALVTIGLGYEVALAATAQCREALVSKHRAYEIKDGVLGQGGGQGLPRPRAQGASFMFFELAGHEEDPPQLAGGGVHWGVDFPSFPRMVR